MASKYEPLDTRLAEVPDDQHSTLLTFEELDRLVGGPPPAGPGNGA